MTTVVKGKILRQDIEHWDGVTKTANRRDQTGGTISGLVCGYEVDVLASYGNGENYTLQTIKDCIRRIGTASVTLIFNPGTWTIDDDLTIGSNFVCRVPAGAVFNVSSGKTLTFSGPVYHDAQTWTSGSGTVTENGTRYLTGKLDLTGSVLQGASPLVFEGGTDNGFETTFAITNPTADRTVTFPDSDVNLGSIPSTSGNNTFSGNNDFTGVNSGLVIPCDGRLTLTTATPVTSSDVTAATTLYFTPHKGNKLALYDGSSKWKVYAITELSIAVPATTNTMYDVFVYDNSGTPTLELTAWTNDTTRATALTFQNGVYVKTGATTRRYLGSFRTTGSSGQTEDSLAKRYVWNYYNRVVRALKVIESTDTWNYTNATFRQANNSTANQVDFVRGVNEDIVHIQACGLAANAGGSNVFVHAGIGIDSTSTNSATITLPGAAVTGNSPGVSCLAFYNDMLSAGRHTGVWLEKSTASGTTTWSGDSGSAPDQQAGIFASILG